MFGICSCKLPVALVQIFFLWEVKCDNVLLHHVMVTLMVIPPKFLHTYSQ